MELVQDGAAITAGAVVAFIKLLPWPLPARHNSLPACQGQHDTNWVCQGLPHHKGEHGEHTFKTTPGAMGAGPNMAIPAALARLGL